MTDEHDDRPLEDLASSIEERDSGGLEAFDDIDVPELDPEALWDELEVDEPVLPESTPTVRTIPKRVYCQRCEYFSEPPDVTCHHEGTAIRQLVDQHHFEVENCPVVAQDEALGEQKEDPRR